jgi:hypothetical protein
MLFSSKKAVVPFRDANPSWKLYVLLAVFQMMQIVWMAMPVGTAFLQRSVGM